jgi:hypothetical protein
MTLVTLGPELPFDRRNEEPHQAVLLGGVMQFAELRKR